MSEAEEKQHAQFSPSGTKKWFKCPGSLALEATCENKSSIYAAEGTAAHTLAEWTFKDRSHNARAYLGRVIEIVESDGQTYNIDVSEDMCAYVQTYVDNVLARIEEYKLRGEVVDVVIEIEKRVDFSHIVGQPGQFGTADVFVLIEYADGNSMLSIEDLKYGQGVAVTAEDNTQLKTYSAAALYEYELTHNVTEVNTVIHMVRKDYISEHMYTADEIRDFMEELGEKAEKGREALEHFDICGGDEKFKKAFLRPGEHCKAGFCNARDKCPALASFAMDEIMDDFVDLETIEGDVKKEARRAVDKLDSGTVTREQLAEFMDAADIIDDWLRAVRGRVEAELLAGKEVPGYKLVEGKKGNRAWVSTTDAEDTLKSMRIRQDDMYKKTLITPTQAEKLVKGSVRKWNRIKDLITQSEGKPSVAPLSDNRKAIEIQPVAEDFDVIEDDEGDQFNDLA